MTPFLVAEIGASHLGSLERARALLAAAAKAGAHAVKLQCWTPGTMVLDPEVAYSGPGPWNWRSLRTLYEECFTPWEWFPILKSDADALGIELFASAFDRGAVDFLEELGVKRHKISSFELVDLDLISYAASKGKPMILSTGMASLQEIKEAVQAARVGGLSARAPDLGRSLTLLRCVSGYPSRSEEAGLMLMQSVAQDYCAWHGLSDHTLTDTTAIAATALGASMIEKHLTLSRADGGPDAAFSLEPAEFARMAAAVRETAAACDPAAKFGPQESEKAHVALRRSLYWSRDLEVGHIITDDDMVTARPALGLSPAWRPELIGHRIINHVRAHTPVKTVAFSLKRA